MNTERIQNADIDRLKELQPEGWTDIRPYFYYYSRSAFCDPLKITSGNKVIAVGTTIRHQDTAWLAHIIVHPEFRNRGLGRELAADLVERLDKTRFTTIYLDATDMGYPVYKKLGFEVETDYIHLDGRHNDLYLADPTSIIPYDKAFRDELLDLDKLISGENRTDVLSDHLSHSLLYIADKKLLGAYFPSLLDGFILAKGPIAGTELIKLRMRSKNTFRFPTANQAAINFLLGNGYEKVRTSKRMILGEKRRWSGEGIFNRISGGLG